MQRFVVFFVAVFGMACGDNPLGPIDSAAGKAQKGAEALADGLKNIDPVALNKLISENAQLRTDLEAIRSRVNGLSLGTGVVTLRDRRVVLRISHYTGSHTISTWIDEPQNWVWKDRRLIDQSLKLPLDDGAFLNAHCAATGPVLPLTNIRACSPEHWAANVHGTVHAHTINGVQPAFARFLSEAPLTPGPDTRDINIHEQFLTLGGHVIAFVLTPRAKDSVGRWSFRGQLVSVAANGNEQLLKEFDLTSDDHSQHQLGNPLPPVKAFVHVSTGS